MQEYEEVKKTLINKIIEENQIENDLYNIVDYTYNNLDFTNEFNLKNIIWNDDIDEEIVYNKIIKENDNLLEVIESIINQIDIKDFEDFVIDLYDFNKYFIKSWQTENDRDQGFSMKEKEFFIFENAKNFAKDLIYKKDFKSAEISDLNNELCYGIYCINNKIEEEFYLEKKEQTNDLEF